MDPKFETLRNRDNCIEWRFGWGLSYPSPKLCFNRDRLSRQVAGCFFCLCAFDTEERGFPRLQLLGLDPKATYALGSIEGKAAEGTPAEASGAWWMNHGIEVALRGDF